MKNTGQPNLTRNPIDPFKNNPFWPVTRLTRKPDWPDPNPTWPTHFATSNSIHPRLLFLAHGLEIVVILLLCCLHFFFFLFFFFVVLLKVFKKLKTNKKKKKKHTHTHTKQKPHFTIFDEPSFLEREKKKAKFQNSHFKFHYFSFQFSKFVICHLRPLSFKILKFKLLLSRHPLLPLNYQNYVVLPLNKILILILLFIS